MKSTSKLSRPQEDLENLDLVCGALLVLLVEDVNVPFGIRFRVVTEGHIEAQVVVLPDRADKVVLFLRELDLLEVGFDAVKRVAMPFGSRKRTA